MAFDTNFSVIKDLHMPIRSTDKAILNRIAKLEVLWFQSIHAAQVEEMALGDDRIEAKKLRELAKMAEDEIIRLTKVLESRKS